MSDKKEIDLQHLANRAFNIIELIEIAGISNPSFSIIRKKLLDLGNDIKRLDQRKEGE